MSIEAKFKCIITGHPVKVVEWYKDGSAIVNDAKRVTISADGTLLHINNVQRQDVGMYQCMVSNDFDSVQGCGQLLLGCKLLLEPWFLCFNDKLIND